MCKVIVLINTLCVMRTLTDAWKMQFLLQRELLSREGTDGVERGEETQGMGQLDLSRMKGGLM